MSSYFGGLTAQPNIVIIMTDQQRAIHDPTPCDFLVKVRRRKR